MYTHLIVAFLVVVTSGTLSDGFQMISPNSNVTAAATALPVWKGCTNAQMQTYETVLTKAIQPTITECIRHLAVNGSHANMTISNSTNTSTSNSTNSSMTGIFEAFNDVYTKLYNKSCSVQSCTSIYKKLAIATYPSCITPNRTDLHNYTTSFFLKLHNTCELSNNICSATHRTQHEKLKNDTLKASLKTCQEELNIESNNSLSYIQNLQVVLKKFNDSCGKDSCVDLYQKLASANYTSCLLENGSNLGNITKNSYLKLVNTCKAMPTGISLISIALCLVSAILLFNFMYIAYTILKDKYRKKSDDSLNDIDKIAPQ